MSASNSNSFHSLMKRQPLQQGAGGGRDREARFTVSTYPKQKQVEGFSGASSPFGLNPSLGMSSLPFSSALSDNGISEYGLVDLENDLSFDPMLSIPGGELLLPFPSQSITFAVGLDNIFEDSSDSSNLGSSDSPDSSFDNYDTFDTPDSHVDANNNNMDAFHLITTTSSHAGTIHFNNDNKPNTKQNNDSGTDDNDSDDTNRSRSKVKRVRSLSESESEDDNDYDETDETIDEQMLAKLKARPRRKRQSIASAHLKKQVGRICASCQTTKTPQWRKGPNGVCLCNACGLHVKHKLTKLENARNRKQKMSPELPKQQQLHHKTYDYNDNTTHPTNTITITNTDNTHLITNTNTNNHNTQKSKTKNSHRNRNHHNNVDSKQPKISVKLEAHFQSTATTATSAPSADVKWEDDFCLPVLC